MQAGIEQKCRRCQVDGTPNYVPDKYNRYVLIELLSGGCGHILLPNTIPHLRAQGIDEAFPIHDHPPYHSPPQH